ncbi:TM2 domain-containing protein [Roseomonas sp. BN140053]|uniref:TM2 domain-containing protein n=1 Tax=Roseomonas sp. BN140053 TaxID=3391898 RepID=UPI0039EAE34A
MPVPSSPPPPAAALSDAAALMRYDANKKSALVAYLLWFFAGFLGGHRFYLGRIFTAVLQLLITLLSALFTVLVIGVFGLMLVGLWVLIDAVLIPGMVREHNNRLIRALGH